MLAAEADAEEEVEVEVEVADVAVVAARAVRAWSTQASIWVRAGHSRQPLPPADFSPAPPALRCVHTRAISNLSSARRRSATFRLRATTSSSFRIRYIHEYFDT